MGLRSPLLPPVAAGEDAALHPSTLFGPTCDGLDTVCRDVPMPRLRNGDWVLFPRFGAYTIAGAVNFNGESFPHPCLAGWGAWGLDGAGRSGQGKAARGRRRAIWRGHEP